MRRPTAFTLIELLVVIGIIAVLIGILLPTLTVARKTAKLATCGSMERQLGVGVAAYANEYRGLIPRGPSINAPFPAIPFNSFASSQIWIQATAYNAHGVLLKHYIDDKRAMFCPGDDTIDPVQELARIDSVSNDAFSSYLYRQLDQVTAGKLEDLGNNDLGKKARALMIDSNALLSIPDSYRTNHDAAQVNILFVDGHVKMYKNLNDIFSLRDADLGDIEARLNQLLQNADSVEAGDVTNVPNP